MVGLTCFALTPALRAACQNGCDSFNTFLGERALVRNTFGYGDTAVGYFALSNNTTGYENTVVGNHAMDFNDTGYDNTAIGSWALYQNTTGYENTATGVSALQNNTTGFSNTASGAFALPNNNGSRNTANGADALYSNTTGSSNTATGYDALYTNTIGNYNTATGVETLVRNTSGSSNTALGYYALNNNSTGNNNIALGEHAGSNRTTGSNNIDIGNLGVAGESKTIRIGIQGTQNKTFIAGISGATVPGGVGVLVGNNGKLGTVVSSERFKEDIQPMDKASEAIHALKPVTFRYKEELDPDGIPQFGLVAEEVEKVNPDLVARDEQGKPYTVRYEAVNAMLLNEFLEEHRKGLAQDETIGQLKSAIAKHEATIVQQQKTMEILMATVKNQAVQIENVSAHLRVCNPAPRVVANNR